MVLPAYFCEIFGCRVPLISEAEARMAMLEHCSQHCCYGKGAATDMAMSKMESSSAFHVSRGFSCYFQLLIIFFYSRNEFFNSSFVF